MAATDRTMRAMTCLIVGNIWLVAGLSRSSLLMVGAGIFWALVGTIVAIVEAEHAG